MRREDGAPTIGLAIIAKNEEKTLPRLFDSLGLKRSVPAEIPDAAAVDAVVVCDTGSEDETRKISEEYGAQVVEFEWVQDFGKARQASYDALPEGLDFTLWADADDEIEGAGQLRELASRLPPEILGTIHRYDYAQDPAGNCICELWRERLVRAGCGASWRLPVHEVLDVPGQLTHVDEVIWHHRTPEDRERDPERNYEILAADRQRAEEADELTDPRTLAYLGTEAMTLLRPGEAVPLFREYLDRPDATWTEERCQVGHKLSVCLRRMADEAGAAGNESLREELLDQSAQAAFAAIQERPDWADGYLDLAELALTREQPERCLYFCGVAERLEPPRTLLIINPLEYSYQPILMRSVALAKLGRAEEAWAATNQALQITPYREDLLGQAAMIAERVKVADAKRQILALREMLVRYDENEKAAILMRECVPYIVLDDLDVHNARLDQREMTLHATDPEVYAGYYRENPNEAPFEAQGVPIPEAHERFHRLGFLREGIREQVGAEL